MSNYNHRITIACPQSMISAGNQLACCMGVNMHDLNTFREAAYQDSEGNLYAVCSTSSTSRVLQAASAQEIERPDFDVDEVIDMEAANTALSNLVKIAAPVDPDNPTLAATDKLTAYIDIDPQFSILMMGLSRVPEEQ